MVCSLAAEAFVPPLRGNFIMIRRTGRKRTRLYLEGLEESTKNHVAVGINLISSELPAGPLD